MQRRASPALSSTQITQQTRTPNLIEFIPDSKSQKPIIKAYGKAFEDPKILNETGKELLVTRSNSYFFFDRLLVDTNSDQTVLRITKDFIFPVYRFYVKGRRVAKMEPKISIPTTDFLYRRKDGTENIEITGDFFSFNFKFIKNGKAVGFVSRDNGQFKMTLCEGENVHTYLGICIVVGRQIELNESVHDKDKNIFI
jgi:uncharacterized protein YxjI